MKHKKKQAKKLTIVDKVVLVLNCILSAALLLSYLSPSTDPQDFSLIAVLGFGYQVLLLINVVFVIYWLIRASPYATIPVASILLGFNTFTSYYKFNSGHPGGKVRDSADIRLMEYNVHVFKGIDEFEGMPSQNRVLRMIDDKQPDIIAFEEYLRHKQGVDTIVSSIKKTLHSDFCFYKLFKKGRDPNDSSGNAIFSKYPIIDAGVVDAPEGLGLDAIFIDVKPKNTICRIYCIHLGAVQMKENSKSHILNGDVNLEKSSFILGKLTSAFVMRSHQIAVLKRHMEKCTYPYIITGDFNDTPNSFAVNELGEGLKNAFDEKGGGLGVTYYSKFPILQIDYILATPQFEVVNYEAVDKKISDHRPLISDVRLQ